MPVPTGLIQNMLTGPGYAGARKALLTHGLGTAVGAGAGAISAGEGNRMAGALGGAALGAGAAHGTRALMRTGALGNTMRSGQRIMDKGISTLANKGFSREGLTAADNAMNARANKLHAIQAGRAAPVDVQATIVPPEVKTASLTKKAKLVIVRSRMQKS